MRIAAIVMVLVISAGLLPVPEAVAEGEVYRWVDENGVVHFGDRAEGNASAEVVQMENSPARTSPPAAAASSEAGNDPDGASPSYAQTLRDERAAKRQEAAEKQKTIAANCKRSREAVAQLEPSPRVMVRNEDGSVTRLDDNERLKALNQAKTYIAENCVD
jgi:hypothetical protein